jgi:sulfite reductase beta subunit-like hemoprotein
MEDLVPLKVFETNDGMWAVGFALPFGGMEILDWFDTKDEAEAFAEVQEMTADLSA